MLVTALVLGGCGKDASGPSNRLGQELSLELAALLLATGWGINPLSETVDETSACPRGGTVRMTGTFTENLNTAGSARSACSWCRRRAAAASPPNTTASTS